METLVNIREVHKMKTSFLKPPLRKMKEKEGSRFFHLPYHHIQFSYISVFL